MKVTKKTSTQTIGRITKITHSQTVGQSMNYQSTSAQFGAEMEVASTDPKEVRAAIKSLETLIESSLASKVKDHQEFLLTLAENRR